VPEKLLERTGRNKILLLGSVNRRVGLVKKRTTMKRNEGRVSKKRKVGIARKAPRAINVPYKTDRRESP